MKFYNSSKLSRKSQVYLSRSVSSFGLSGKVKLFKTEFMPTLNGEPSPKRWIFYLNGTRNIRCNPSRCVEFVFSGESYEFMKDEYCFSETIW